MNLHPYSVLFIHFISVFSVRYFEGKLSFELNYIISASISLPCYLFLFPFFIVKLFTFFKTKISSVSN